MKVGESEKVPSEVMVLLLLLIFIGNNVFRIRFSI